MRERKQKPHIARRLWAAIALVLLLLRSALPALGSADRAELSLELRCVGPGCAVGLFDAGGAELGRTTLPADGAGVLSLSVNGAGLRVYTVRVLNRDSEEREYDRSVYTVCVNAAPGGDGTLLVSVSLHDGGEEKAEELLFVNRALTPPPVYPDPTPTPAPTPTPTPGPETSPEPSEPPEPTVSPGPFVTPPPYVPPTPTRRPDPPPPEAPDPEEEEFEDLFDDDIPLGPLPQTGQLWWPVPVLAAAGLLCVVLGLRERRKTKRCAP